MPSYFSIRERFSGVYKWTYSISVLIFFAYFITELNIESTIAINMAYQIFETLNPGTSLLAMIIIRPFNTRTKRPSVRMVMGSVRITNIGLSSALSSPRTRATISAVIKFST